MEFGSFPFDIHVCNFKVHSLEGVSTNTTFRYEVNTPGIAWKTQTILEYNVAFNTLSSEGIAITTINPNLMNSVTHQAPILMLKSSFLF